MHPRNEKGRVDTCFLSRERENLQVRISDSVTLYRSKRAGNVQLPLTRGGDCSRLYLKGKTERERQ